MSFKPSSLEKIIKWEYQYNMIKVNDGKFHSKHLKIPGCVAIDVQPCFMGFYSKDEKSSLAYYLKECKLDNKVNLPIHRMNKYYEMALKETNATTAEQMHKVAKYCIINALSYQRLMVKHNVINKYREIASIAFLSLFDAHYFAGGKNGAAIDLSNPQYCGFWSCIAVSEPQFCNSPDRFWQFTKPI
ncbi:hypothetical protein RclHR1_09610008 [Rhizophagus clarus]|uniref:Uncharacterized protein n=1 Tax=Rhizophagus clarus TaxID=94130 RepID=A0A2Z6S723_9GLOM|nr:hypothetical protein RclHR1_09610008 [Rhizophagus clarus]